MALSYVLVTPYTVAKNRVGGIIGRLLLRSDIELVGAQLFEPDAAFASAYAGYFRAQADTTGVSGFLADYVEKRFPTPQGGPRQRALLLVFRGEDVCSKLAALCGHIDPARRGPEEGHGESIRDTWADLVLCGEDPKKYVYFEPAVFTPRNAEEAAWGFSLFARFLEKKPNIVAEKEGDERTLVILKPDNWRTASSRPGAIIDMFSRTGLTIVGVKIFRFSLEQALEFYAQVKGALLEKLAPVFGAKARKTLEEAYKITLSEESAKSLAASFGAEYAVDQFEQIVEFMSGWRPCTCPAGEEASPGRVKCMILVYEGKGAVDKIRAVLGPTDPLKAPEGTVRREFGSNVMVNTAHASDSAESYNRESRIVKVDENPLRELILR